VTLLPALSPGFVEGFAAGTLLSAICLLLVIAGQRAGRPRRDPRQLSLQRTRLRAIGWRRAARQRTDRPPAAQENRPPSARAGAASVRMPLPRGSGRHAAPAGGNGRLAGRRRSRLLTTRD
jgi:hypothetical protein